MTRSRDSLGGQGGFSLIELAIVLVIIGLLIGGGIVALETTTERERRASQNQQLEQVRDALHGFAMSNGRLPCPDTGGEPGAESTTSDTPPFTCADVIGSRSFGALPWVTLGLGSRDAWGHRLHYAVEAEYAASVDEPGGSAFNFDTASPSLRVRTSANNAIAENLATNLPAIVVSFGPQGGQVWTDTGFTCPGVPEGFSEDARENCNETRTFVDAGFRRPQDGDGGFQHMLTWLADPVLKARMVDAGRLP